MPKSKLKSSMSVGKIQGIQAVREKVDIETVTVNGRLIKRPKFMRAQISPGFRAIGSIETDEVEYDTYVKWAITIPKGWAKAYGESDDDEAYAVATAPNGDIIVAGVTYSFGAGGADFWVLRLDGNGNIKWQKAYGGSGTDELNAVTIAPNGDIIVAGRTNSFGAGDSDFWVLRLDENGNIKWQKAYGGSSLDRACAITIAPNGDIIVAGATYSFGAGDSDFWVLRLDENGNIKWQKAYGGSGYEEVHAIATAENGDIIVAGVTDSFGAGSADFWVLRLDENGNIKWQKTYGGSGYDEAYAVATAHNGDIIVAGITDSFGAGYGNFLVIRLDENGNIKWQKTYGGSGIDVLNAVTIADNGDIIVAGSTDSFGVGKGNFWIIRLDESGNIKWQKAYGGEIGERALAVATVENGDIIVAGVTDSFGAGSADLLVIRLDENGNVSTSTLIVTDTNCVVTETNCTVTDTSCIVTDTSCTVTDTDCTVTETDCVVTEL